jgi:Peptidase family M28
VTSSDTGAAPGLLPEELLRHVRALVTRFPHRHAGEPDEEGATRYIADVLHSYGVRTSVFEVPVMGWEVEEPARLEFVSRAVGAIECAPLIFSGSTPPDGLEGELRYVGASFLAGGFEWEKFAIVDEDGQWRAFVMGRPDGPAISLPGPPAGIAGVADVPLYTWPACVVGDDSLATLRELETADRPVRVRYRCRARFKPDSRSYTVVGEVVGHNQPEEIVILGSHQDAAGAVGFPEAIVSPGANDNASAVAIFLELARHYQAVGSPKTLWFCFFGGEERNLMMSREFARRLVDTRELDRVVCYLGIDQAANGDILRLLSSANEPHLDPPLNLRPILADAAARLDLHSRFEVIGPAPVHAASDHWPFYYAGVPAFLTGWHPFPTYHRSGDTAAYCSDDNKYLATANVTIAMLEAVLRTGPWPARARGHLAGHVTPNERFAPLSREVHSAS